MTQTAHIPARGAASDVPHKPARLGPELRPETLPASTTPLYGAIDDGLIPCLKIRERRRRIAFDTIIILLGRTRRGLAFATNASRTRAVYVSRARVAVCGCVRIWDATRRPWKDTTL